jgi:hypothetical protein
MDETIREIISRANRPNDQIVFDPDPKKLVEKVIALVKKSKSQEFKLNGIPAKVDSQ